MEQQEAGYYNFSNIQYAHAPRFSAPTPIKNVNRSVNTGQRAGVCPAVFPAWYGMSTLYQSGQLSLDELNSTFAELQFLNPNSSSESINRYLSDTDTIFTENCLALDVVVPEELWSKSRNNSHSAGKLSYSIPCIQYLLSSHSLLTWHPSM